MIAGSAGRITEPSRVRGGESAERKEGTMAQEGMEGGMVCSKCGQSFETQEELDRHMQETHPDEGMGGMPEQS